MSPNPLITPAPKRPVFPRQTDPYDLSSFNAALSSINAQYSISIDSSSYDWSSLLAQYTTYPEYDYSSIFAQYSTQDFASLLDQLTSTQTSRTENTHIAANPTNAALSSSHGDSNGAGLSTTAKIAIGVGVAVPAFILLLAGLGIFLWCAGKRKGKKNSTTIITPMAQSQPSMPPPTSQQYQPQPHVSAQNQGYTPGYQHQQGFAHPQFQQIPTQYVRPQQVDADAAIGGYTKGPDPGYAELESSYHFVPSGVVEIGETEAPAVEEEEEKKKKGWRHKLGRKPVPPPS